MKPLLSALPGQIAWPSGIRWEELHYAMVESPAEVRFLGSGEIRKASDFPRGVAFGPKAELRWMRRAGGYYHFVYLSDDGLPLREDAPHQSQVDRLDDSEVPQHMFLWNASDGRIPRSLSYPCREPGAGQRLAVLIRHYKLVRPTTVRTDEPGVETLLFRCVDLAPVEAAGGK